MDLVSLLGLLVSLLVVLNATLGDPAGLDDLNTLVLVVVGGLGGTLVSCRGAGVARTLAAALKALFRRRYDFRELVMTIVGYAETARREGILALEPAMNETRDKFLASGLRLAIDGTEPELIQSILGIEVQGLEARHRQGHQTLRTLGWHFAAFGLLGALLSVVTAQLSSGPDLASRATPALISGLLLSLAFGFTLRRRLKDLSEEEILAKHMIQEGVSSIQAGDNPRIIEQKLNVFLPPAGRVVSAPDKKRPKPDVKPPESGPNLMLAAEVIRRIQAALASSGEAVSGRPTLDNLMPLVGEDGRRELYSLLEESPPTPAKTLLNFAFEDIATLTDREVQMVLRETDTHGLVLALKGATEAVIEKVMANVSERVGTMIREELVARRSVRLRQVVDAQLRMLHVIQLLSAR